MARHRTAGAGSGSSRTPLIHPAPFRAPRIILVVIGRCSASAPASPSRGPGNGILPAETGGRIQAQNTGERSEFGSQTATRLANRPKLKPRVEGRSSLCNPRTDDTRGRRAQIRSSAGPRMERPSRAGHDPRRRVRLERLRLPQPFAGRQGDHRTNWNGHRFFGLKAVRTGASGRKRNVTPRPNSLLDIGLPPTLAGFAPAMPDRSLPRGFSVKRLTDLPMLWSEQWRAVGLRSQFRFEPNSADPRCLRQLATPCWVPAVSVQPRRRSCGRKRRLSDP